LISQERSDVAESPLEFFLHLYCGAGVDASESLNGMLDLPYISTSSFRAANQPFAHTLRSGVFFSKRHADNV
jgi:hypothetical protein